MEEDKVLEALKDVNQAIKENKSFVERLDNLEKKFGDRLTLIEDRADQYSIFISKTSGFFTRIGFYLDALVIYLRGLWKK